MTFGDTSSRYTVKLPIAEDILHASGPARLTSGGISACKDIVSRSCILLPANDTAASP